MTKKLDVFFKGEPYNPVPSGIHCALTPSVQKLHFFYLVNLTKHETAMGQWAVQFPPLLLFLLFVSLAAGILLLVIDGHCRSNRSNRSFGDLLQVRLLYVFSFLINASFSLRSMALFSSRSFVGFFVMTCALRTLNLILCGSMQNKMVLTDLSDVSDNLQHMLDTKRRMCYVSDELYIDWFRYAKPGSMFNRLWLANHPNSCVFHKDASEIPTVTRLNDSFGIVNDELM